MGFVIMGSSNHKDLLHKYLDPHGIDHDSIARIEVTGNGRKGDYYTIYWINDDGHFCTMMVTIDG
jgi:hypothetical protein